jgi:hypothetical protein
MIKGVIVSSDDFPSGVHKWIVTPCWLFTRRARKPYYMVGTAEEIIIAIESDETCTYRTNDKNCIDREIIKRMKRIDP